MPRILVIEDMPDSADVAAKILQRYGHEVYIAENGERGLSLAEEHLPDLILYDFWLPDIEASAFLARLRSIDKLVNIPILVCTATPPELVEKSVGKDGFAALIRKPYRLSGFMEIIEQHLGDE